MSAIVDPEQELIPNTDGEIGGGGGGGGKEADGGDGATVTMYNRAAWLRRVQKRDAEVFWDYDTFDTNPIPLTTTFIKNIGRMRNEQIFSNNDMVEALVRYVSRDIRDFNTDTLFVHCDDLAYAIAKVLTGIGNKFDAKQLVLGFGETYDENLVDGQKRVPLKNVFKNKDGIRPQFKKRRVWRGNTQQEVTPKQQHANIQNIFCVAVAKRMALNEQKKQYDLGLNTAGAMEKEIRTKISNLETEYAYLLSRIRNVSWVQLSPEFGFLTETPSLYNGAKSAAVGQLSYKKKVDETKLQHSNLYKRIMKDYKKKRQRNRITDPPTDPVRPHGVLPTTRKATKEKLQRTGSTGRIALNYQ